MTVQLKSVSKVFSLLTSSYQLHNCEELLVTIVLLLFLQDQHEVKAETGLHHHPVHGTREVNVCGKEDNVLPLQGGDGLVLVHQVGHDSIQGALPLAGSTRAGAGVRPELAQLLVVCFLCVGQSYFTPRRGIFTREKY